MKALLLGLRIAQGLMAILSLVMLGLFLACLVVVMARSMLRARRLSRFVADLEEWDKERLR